MPEDATRDFGALLKDARARAGIDLRTIATNTKISMQSLAALERNDVSRLPGGIFVRAFVRAYAKEVGLDPETTVSQFVARFPDVAAVEDPAAHEPVQERRVFDDEPGTSQIWRVVGWALPFVLVIVFFAFGGRLGWMWDLVRPAAAKVEPAAEQPPASETPVMTTPAAMPQATPPPVDAAAFPPNAGADAQGASNPLGSEGAAAATVPAVASTGRTPETITSPSAVGRFRMLLAASARCWVTVRSDGQVVFSGTMQPGDRQDLVLGGAVSLTVGNAAAMSVELDGQPARPLGAAGEVKTIRLTAETLKDLVASR